MMGELAGAGVGLAATKFIAEHRELRPQRAASILSQNLFLAFCIGFTLTVALNVFSTEISVHLLGRAELAGLLKWGSLLLFFSTLYGGILGALTGFEQFRKIAFINVANGVISLPLQATLLYYFGINGVVAALAITSTLTFFLAYQALRKVMKSRGLIFDFQFTAENLKHLYTFNLPALLSTVMVVPVNWACNLMLVRQTDGFGEMGLFNAANQWRMALLFIPTTIGSVVLPILSNMLGSKDISGYRKILSYNLLINILVSTTIIIFVFFASGFIMSKYGDGFLAGEKTLRILILVAGLMAINNIVGHAITSAGDLWVGFIFNLAWAAALLISAFFLVSSRGALGLAYANLFAYGLHTVWQYLFVEWRLRRGMTTR
jgi:O-antigen/teichoic acid export membrane protein